MHFLKFYSDKILYMFRIGNFIHLQEAILLYMQFMVCIMYSCRLAATMTVVAASLHECMINCMYSKTAS